MPDGRTRLDGVDRRTVLRASSAVAGVSLFSTQAIAANRIGSVNLIESMITYQGDGLLDRRPMFNCGIRDYKKEFGETRIVLRDNLSDEVEELMRNNEIVINGLDYRTVPGTLFGDRKRKSLPIKSGANLSEEQSIQTAIRTQHPAVTAKADDTLRITAMGNEYRLDYTERDSLSVELEDTEVKVIGDEPGRPETLTVTPTLELESFGKVDVYGGDE